MMTKNRVQGARCKVQGFAKTCGYTQQGRTSIPAMWVLVSAFFLFPFSFFLFPAVSCAAEYSLTEAKIINFIKELYNNSNDVQVRLNAIPSQLKENTRVKNINFRKVPDTNGDGICMVEVITGTGRVKTVQVPFRVFTKRKLFVLNTAGKKDQVIKRGDLSVQETYMNGKGNEYPSSFEDLTGKVLKKDVPVNTIITYQMLEEPLAVQRGEIVSIIAENRKLLVMAKGKTIEKGRIGDIIRVKNISSGKEVAGRIADQNTVTIDF